MGRNNRKTRKPKSIRRVSQKSRPETRAANKSVREASRQLDQVVQVFDSAVDALQNSLEKLRETLPELVALGIRRDCLRRIKALADDGILDGLQRLATALENCVVTGRLPESVVPLHRSAGIAVDHICRTFEVQTVFQPGDSFTLAHEQVKDFDWSALSGELNLPANVEILRSGWKTADTVFVLPRVRVRQEEKATSKLADGITIQSGKP